MNILKLSQKFLWNFSVLLCLLSSSFVATNDEIWGDQPAKEKNAEPTRHQSNLLETSVNFANVSLSGNPEDAARNTVLEITNDLHHRISTLYEKAISQECRALIGKHYGYFVKALALEKPLPFADIRFNNSCEGDVEYDFDNLPPGIHMGHIQSRTYQPPRNETEYIASHEVVLCYGLLAHDNAAATIRFMEAVDEPTTIFFVHVDAKYEETHAALKEYASSRSRVTVLDHPYRVRVNWGGFSMVNATLQLLHFADQHDFTHFVHMASTAYPIASNRRIRNTLASFPKDANFLHIILKPAVPAPSIWNYFVECDDRLHRIYRMPPIRKATHGADLYTSSQWFIISKDFATYLANPVPGSFLEQYLDYIPHTVVADEAFFGTVLRNTHFCHKHHNWNFLHLQFDRWENERSLELRDERKCVMPDPNHCGRSPTTLTTDYLDILELSEDLFARKFLDDVDPQVKNIIDSIRLREEFQLTALNITGPKKDPPKVELKFDGHGTLFVAKETIHSSMPMCLGLGETQHKVRLVPCFYEWVPSTLAPDWETGAVVQEETPLHTRWEITQCSSDGNLERSESGEIEVKPGLYTPTGPRCMIQIMDGVRKGRCLDGESLDVQPGGPVHVYPCTKRWHQFLSFGNGKEVPKGALHTTVPLHTRNRIAETGREQGAYMCLGVAGRGDLDEEDWLGMREVDEGEYAHKTSYEDGDSTVDSIDQDSLSLDVDEVDNDAELRWPPLVDWEGRQLVATSCSNAGAIIEWILVPFIVEDDIEEEQPGSNERGDDEEL